MFGDKVSFSFSFLRDLRALRGEIRIFSATSFPKPRKFSNIAVQAAHSFIQLLFLFFRIRERLFENGQHRLQSPSIRRGRRCRDS